MVMCELKHEKQQSVSKWQENPAATPPDTVSAHSGARAHKHSFQHFNRHRNNRSVFSIVWWRASFFYFFTFYFFIIEWESGAFCIPALWAAALFSPPRFGWWSRLCVPKPGLMSSAIALMYFLNRLWHECQKHTQALSPPDRTVSSPFLPFLSHFPLLWTKYDKITSFAVTPEVHVGSQQNWGAAGLFGPISVGTVSFTFCSFYVILFICWIFFTLVFHIKKQI